MALFAKKSTETKSSATRLVATGKRVKGTWTMESRLPIKAKRTRQAAQIMERENRRVRTLH